MEPKKSLFLLAFIMITFFAAAQISTSYFENKDALKAFPKLKQVESKEMALKKMPKFNLKRLLDEDLEMEGMTGIPTRFGQGFDVDYTIRDGIWIQKGDKRIWSMKFSSSGAYSLNFIFSELSLAHGAELYIFNTNGSMVYGPVTAKANTIKGATFLTDLVAGDEAVIQIIEPTATNSSSSLRISRVVHGYKNTFSFIETAPGAGNATLTCHNDVNCSSLWDVESKAVAVVLLASGDATCSGSLLNNTAQNKKPYFLTAFHCIDIDTTNYGVLTAAEKTTAENWMFRFRFKSTSCNGTTPTSWVSYNRAYFRAAYLDSDFLLMELQSAIYHDATFAGWSRSITPAASATNIHHPKGDLMKISFTDNPLIFYPSWLSWINSKSVLVAETPPNSHWRATLTSGTTEGGSSGSPLFNPEHLVVGQLHGGGSGCAPVYKYYGRFDLSWTGGGTNDTRLSNWLAPNGTNPMTLMAMLSIPPDHDDYSATMSATYNGYLAEATIININSRIDQYSWSIINVSTGATVTNSGWSISSYNSEQGKPSMHRVLVTGGNLSNSSGLRLRVCAHNSAGWGECLPLGYLSNGSYSSLSASPNPASNLLNIEIEVLQPAIANAPPIQQVPSANKNPSIAIPQQSVYEVKIFNTATGAMVYQQTMTGTSKQIDVSGLSNGVYTLSISDGSGNPPMTQQIVVAH